MTVITKRFFDKTADGRDVSAYILDGGEGVCAHILDFGGIINKLLVTDKDGKEINTVLGYDEIKHYEKTGAYYGALIGRCANRIGKSRFTLEGKEYILPANDKGNQLHGGPSGFSHRIWDAKENADGTLTLSIDSPDMDMGYPGNVHVEVTYALKGRELEIRYTATSDATTVVNLTNHAYFDITGAGSGRTLDSLLWLDCDKMTDTDKELIPNGNILSVENTPYDFTTPKAVGKDIECDYNLLSFFNGYDTNYYKKGYDKTFAPIASLKDPENGLTMTVMTDLPCVQLYTTNSVDDGAPDFSDGAVHTLHCGVCLETQYAPDCINSPDAEMVILRPDDKFETVTSFVFSK